MDIERKILEHLSDFDPSDYTAGSEITPDTTAELMRQNRRLEILHQLTRDINLDMSIQDIVERTFSQLAAVLPCTFIGIIVPVGGQLQLKALAPHDEQRKCHFDDEHLSWQLIREKVALLFEGKRGAGAYASLRASAAGAPTSFAMAPMHERTRIIGALVVARSSEAAFSREELDFTSQLAGQMAFSINNARLYNQLARATRQWESTFAAVTDSIILIGADGNILRDNGHFPAELAENWQRLPEARYDRRLFGSDSPGADCPLDEICRTGQGQQRRHQTPGGLLIDSHYYPVVNQDGIVTAVTLILKDVTERTKIEAQLAQTAGLAALGEMAAGVAHELNSPLTVVIGTAQMLARDAAGEDKQSLEDVISCGLRCKRIIQNLLTFARQDQVGMSATDLNKEVNQALALLRFQVNRNRIEISDEFDDSLPPIYASGPRVQQVITNFILNARDALDASAQQQKQIRVMTAIEQRDGRDWAAISVSDNAGGIDAELHKRIFMPFFTTKEVGKGTGLGLSVSLGIAEAHNGTIEVESQIGKGSCFTLLLPLVSPRDTGTGG